MAEIQFKGEIYRRSEEILNYFGVRPYTDREKDLIFELALDEAAHKPTFPSELEPRYLTDSFIPGSNVLSIASGGSNNYVQVFNARDEFNSIPGSEFNMPIPDGKKSFERKEYNDADDFYNTVVSLLAPTLKTIFSRVKRIDSIGFVYSFPGNAIITANENVDIQPDADMSKGYVVPGIDQEFAGVSLIRALRKAGYPIEEDMPYVVGNDASFLGLGVAGAQLSIIDGTGFNIARTVIQPDGTLRLDATESGDFLRLMLLSQIENELNRASKHPGTYIAETICGGKSLELLMNRIISEYESAGLLRSIGPISGPQISQLIRHKHPITGFEQYIPADQHIWNILRKPAIAFRDRAEAVITGITSATLHAHPHLLRDRDVYMALEGSTLLYIPGLAQEFTENIQTMFPENDFHFVSSSSVYGAGFAAHRAYARSLG